MTTETSAHTRSVLIVDDNPTNLKLTRFLLDNEGYRVLTATHGLEAIELLQTVHPDLVLMDIQLPEIDGLEVTRRLKSQPNTRDLTIVALSAYALGGEQEKLTEVGCAGFIPKPINIKTFPDLIRKYLADGQERAVSETKTSRVLLAEDDPSKREALKAALVNAGFTVTTAEDGAAALAAAEREHPHLVISDILMPRLDGFSLTEAIRTNPSLAETHVILTTSGAVRETDRSLAQRKGASALVPKTEDAEGLLDAIRDTRTRAPGMVEPEGIESIERIRRSFLKEAREQLNPLIQTDAENWDRSVATQVAHRLAGTGGTLGFPQISQTAFRLESLLGANRTDEKRLNEGVAELDRLFEQAEQAEAGTEVPERVRAIVRSRKFVLVGFSRSEDRRLSQAIEHAGGFCRVQEQMPDPDDPCDLAIVSIRALGSPDGAELGSWPTIIVGPASRLSAIRRTPDVDLLVAPADSTEVLVRSFHLLTRDHARESDGDNTARGPGLVLVVDDDPTITSLLKSTLSHAGMECHTAGSGPEALEKARSIEPDAIVLDVNLPGMDGFEVLSELKDDPRTERVPVLMLTARQQEVDILRGFALGAGDYVVKPFSPMEVAARLGRLLK